MKKSKNILQRQSIDLKIKNGEGNKPVDITKDKEIRLLKLTNHS